MSVIQAVRDITMACIHPLLYNTATTPLHHSYSTAHLIQCDTSSIWCWLTRLTPHWTQWPLIKRSVYERLCSFRVRRVSKHTGEKLNRPTGRIYIYKQSKLTFPLFFSLTISYASSLIHSYKNDALLYHLYCLYGYCRRRYQGDCTFQFYWMDFDWSSKDRVGCESPFFPSSSFFSYFLLLLLAGET